MVNTVSQRTLLGGGADRTIVRSIHIISDGSEESNLIVYDNSTFINDVTKGSLLEIKASGAACLVRLSWDQTTDVPIISFDPSQNPLFCFEDFGGISNPGGTGATGDMLLNTANLDSGDEVFILLVIKQ